MLILPPLSITGKGNHSEGGVQKIKPAVEELCREQNLQFSTEQNAGRMYISLAPVDGGQAGEVPAGNHPHRLQNHGNNAHSQQPQHGSSGGYGEAYPGQQGSYGGGYQNNAGPSSHGQQQQQQHSGGQQQQDLTGVVVEVAKKAFFKKLAGCCVVM